MNNNNTNERIVISDVTKHYAYNEGCKGLIHELAVAITNRNNIIELLHQLDEQTNKLIHTK